MSSEDDQRGTPVVVKIGGARAVDPDGAPSKTWPTSSPTASDVVVVHGGSTAVDET